MKCAITLNTIETRVRALRQLLCLSNSDRTAFFDSYTAFETANAVCSRSDFRNGVALRPLLTEGDERIVAYYKVLNLICALGCVEKMYIPPVIDETLTLQENQCLFEALMANDIKANKMQDRESRVLELGCGRGRIAENMSRNFGPRTTVVGMNIDASQLEEANAWAAKQERTACLEFHEADFNKEWAFPDGSFAGIYAVQPLTYAVSLEHVFREAYRVLEAGGRICILDAVLLDKFDSSNKEHMDMISPVRQLLGMGGAWHHSYWSSALEAAGFHVEYNDDVSLNKTQAPLIRSAESDYKNISKLVGLASCVGAPHLPAMMDRFARHTEAFVEMDSQRLITTSWYICAIKV